MKQSIYLKYFLTLLIIVILCSDYLFAQSKIASPQAAEDYGVAYMDRNQNGIVWSTMNYGRIFNGRAETDFYWPFRSHTTEGQHGGVSSIIFAVKDNVIESFTQSRSAPQDWLPKDGTLQPSASNNVTSGTHTDLFIIGGSVGSYPAVAMSDYPIGIRRTWPLRVDPRDGVAKPWWPGLLPEGFTYEDRFNYEEQPWAIAETECYMVFNDKYNLGKPSLGIEIEEQTYIYARNYAKDFSFVRLIIHNTSDSTIHDAYFGYRFFILDAIGGSNNNYLVAENTGWNPDEAEPDFFYVYMPNRGNIPPDHVPALTGVAVLETPKGNDGKELGVTDFHYSVPPGPQTDEGMWPIISSDPSDPDLPGEPSDYFHDAGPDNRIDNTDWIPENQPGGSWWAFFAMSGPFDLEAGEADTASFALVGGYDLPYLMNNVQTIQEMATNDYKGPSPPPIPTITSAVPLGHDLKITWDTEAETDPAFEGYKLYRREISTIVTPPWGEEILAPDGTVQGVLPIEQWDKIDGVTGFDPLNPYTYLGDDSGLKHTYIDTAVIPGIQYQYAITAYSRPLVADQIPSLETALGFSAAGGRVVPDPNGTILGHGPEDALRINPADSFWIQIETISPTQITGDEYEVSFTDRTVFGGDTVYEQGYNLVNITTGDTLISMAPLTDNSGDNTAIIDGFRINFTGRDKTGEPEIVRIWNFDSPVDEGSNWPYWDVSISSGGLGKDFLIQIDTDNPALLNASPGFGSNTYTVPVKIFNLETGEELTQYSLVGDWAARANNAGDPDYGQPPGAWSLEPGGPNWNPRMDNTGSINHSDFIFVRDENSASQFILYTVQPPDATAPVNGDELFIGAEKPFPRDVVYRFTTTASHVVPSRIDLTEVKAVPNPYFVKARWDTEARIRTIRFINLPEICDIYIFTISGDLVRHIEHRREAVPPTNPDNPGPYFTTARAGLGYHDWELVSDGGISVGYGIYVYVVQTPDGRKQVGKLAIIR